MPAYSATTVIGLDPLETQSVFAAESTASITTSQACVLTPDLGTSNTACTISGFFSGNPGTFEIDVQFAAVNADPYFLKPSTGGTITSATNVSGTYYFTVQRFQPAPGQFVRLNLVSCQNTVNLTGNITR